MRKQDMFTDKIPDIIPGQVFQKRKGLDIQQCNDHKYGIQYADPGKVLNGPEMTDSFLFRRIIDPNGHTCNFYIFPCRPDKYFELKFVFARIKTHFPDGFQRI